MLGDNINLVSIFASFDLIFISEIVIRFYIDVYK